MNVVHHDAVAQHQEPELGDDLPKQRKIMFTSFGFIEQKFLKLALLSDMHITVTLKITWTAGHTLLLDCRVDGDEIKKTFSSVVV